MNSHAWSKKNRFAQIQISDFKLSASALKIIAHRGASARAPENTLAAVRLAAELGAEGVEVDVRVTRDGKLAVLHDTDTRRVAPAQPVYTAKRRRMAELQTLDVGSWKDAKFTGERVPELGHVLSALGPNQEILIELKSREADIIISELNKLLEPPKDGGFPSTRVIVMGFDGVTVRKVKKKRPELRVLLLLNKKPSAHVYGKILSTIAAGHLNGIGQNRTWALAQEQYDELRAAGAILSAWTVDDAKEAQAWRARGFDYLTSNVPDKMKT